MLVIVTYLGDEWNRTDDLLLAVDKVIRHSDADQHALIDLQGRVSVLSVPHLELAFAPPFPLAELARVEPATHAEALGEVVAHFLENADKVSTECLVHHHQPLAGSANAGGRRMQVDWRQAGDRSVGRRRGHVAIENFHGFVLDGPLRRFVFVFVGVVNDWLGVDRATWAVLPLVRD